MENTEILQKNMSNIDRGAYWCRVLGTTLFVFGIVILCISGLPLLKLLGPGDATLTEVVPGCAKIAGGSVSYFIMAWLARRAGDAFESIAALIREMNEIV